MGSRYYHRRWADRRRIDMTDERDRMFWSKFFGIEDEELMEAVDKVGTAAEDVRQYVQRQLTGDWTIHAGRDERRVGLSGD